MRISDTTKKELERLVSLEEAASLLKQSKARVCQHIKDGNLEALRVGKVGVVVDPADLSSLKSKLKKRGRKRTLKRGKGTPWSTE